MAYHFFFGSMHDFLKKTFYGTFIPKYSVLLILSVVLFTVIFILLKKAATNFIKIKLYLNSLLLLLIIVDGGMLLTKAISKKKNIVELPAGFTKCDSCATPDVYFLLADEYAGNTELIDKFGYNDSAFLNSLSKRNFQVIPNSYSNYNYTPFSLASILNMDYLQLQNNNRGQSDLTTSYQSIKNSSVVKFFQANGYQFYNYSIFDFEGQPGMRLENFLPEKTRLITAQTFLSRAKKDLFFNIITRLKSKKALKNATYSVRRNNERIYGQTWKTAEDKSKTPKFIYAHLEMPHYPYYYDKNGTEQPFEKLTEGNQSNKEAYIEYLQHSNRKLLELIDHILHSSSTPPIIILMGDHGFRHFTETVENKYYFMNLSSIYLPSGKYVSFNDSLTAVNFFRILLNTQFQQQFPLLKDSTSYLKD